MQLPEGFRPVAQHSFHVQLHVDNRSGRVDVQGNGNVMLNAHDAGAGFVNLSQIEFLTN